MKSIYFAGPDVFRADILEYVNYLKTICKTFDFTPLIPYEVLAKSTDTIFNRNIELIKQADIVVANVTPFRGTEPDSGTAWEIGFASALEKEIYLFSSDIRTTVKKVKEYFHYTKSLEGEHSESTVVFPDGMFVEPFNYPVNLMLYKSTKQKIHRDIHSVLFYLYNTVHFNGTTKTISDAKIDALFGKTK